MGGGPLMNLKLGEKDMALMLSQHWGRQSQERRTREANTIWIITVTRKNLRALAGRWISLETLPVTTLRDKCLPLFFLTLVFCLKYIFWRSSSSREVSFRMLDRVRRVGSWGLRDLSRLLVMVFSLERCSRASGSP